MSAADVKTHPTAADVDAHLASRAGPAQLADCRTLVALCERATGEPPRMWGPSMVGFGRTAYRYESGRSGEMFRVGFAVRGREIVVYLDAGLLAQAERLAALGPHRVGKSCLYLKRLADIDMPLLEALVRESVAVPG